ncbi:hypothetical protein [Breoghania sp.]|nr:hypothetical protein [Breoghania sp.]MDJ0932817.1 hypothetical protein [Breoghania sp.]
MIVSDALPRDGFGKIRRRALQAEYARTHKPFSSLQSGIKKERRQ